MINDTLQIAIAVVLFLALIFVMLRYVKPRGNQAEFIMGLLRKLSEARCSEEKGVCRPKRKS
jgi:hypothetical protein